MARTILIVAVTLGLLAGCGQKGPLYFPEPDDEDSEQKDDA
jgi:predicted small lipoprotein YifL